MRCKDCRFFGGYDYGGWNMTSGPCRLKLPPYLERKMHQQEVEQYDYRYVSGDQGCDLGVLKDED